MSPALLEAPRLADFDFAYPEELVATAPAEPRDSSRLLIARREGGAPEHRGFRELPELLSPGDCVVLNESRVSPRRLIGRKATGGRVEVLLVEDLGEGLWTALASGLKPGTVIVLPGGLTARAEGWCDGVYHLRLSERELGGYLDRHGLAPLPPYILKRRAPGAPEADRERYQTVYARAEGSIAAPTAGLHFTPGVLEALSRRGVRVARLALHVGRGTFSPVVSDELDEHRMLPEPYRLEASEAALIERTLQEGGRVVAVGTTATRALETLASRPEGLGAGSGESGLFIRPGHRFRAVSGLLTNFHLPRSTPLLLAAAFLGREKLLEAYREAFERRYRLFSYGDAMLIL